MRGVLIGMLAACGFQGPPLAPTDGASSPDAAATAIDAVASCPPGYLAGYRLEITPRTWIDAERACEADAPGQTHLVVLDDDTERTVIASLIPGDVFVGIVRDPGGASPWPWRYVTGGAASYAPWEATEPNNLSGDQYIAVLRQSSQLLYDYGITDLVGSVCECDGRPAVNADYDPATP